MHGFLNINKPQGITSFDAIRRIKKVLPRKVKIGHLGTLDPMATGVLPVAVGHATRIIPFIDDDIKEYAAMMTLGACSDTQDAWGNITYNYCKNVKWEDLQQILPLFSGKIKQIPPMFSAVHHEGKRLYELARQGISVDRKERIIDIMELELIKADLDLPLPQISIRVLCSKGTYIRTLCHDIGQELGTGAILSSLQRTRAGIFRIADAYSLDELDKLDQIDENSEGLPKILLPLDYPLVNFALVNLGEKELGAIMNGNSIIRHAKLSPGKLKVYSPDGCLAAIAESINRGDITLVQPIRVFK